LLWAFFDVQLIPEPISVSSDVGPPLTGDKATQQLRAIAAATTSTDKDARLSLNKEEKGQYQLEKTETTYRYCLRGRSPERSANLETGDPVIHSERADRAYSDLKTVALGLRCHANQAQRQAMEDLLTKALRLKPSIEKPSLDLLDSEACDTDQVRKPRGKNDINEYLDQYCGFVRNIKRIAGIAVPNGLISIKILTRSIDEMIGYLGSIAGFSALRSEPPPAEQENLGAQQQQLCEGQSFAVSGSILLQPPLLVPEYSVCDRRGRNLNYSRPCGDYVMDQYGRVVLDQYGRLVQKYKCFPLLIVRAGRPGPHFVSVSDDDGAIYWVPSDLKEAGHSFDVFETAHQLLSLAKVAKDLPAGNIITVAPIP
jgi:hypothetical protein